MVITREMIKARLDRLRKGQEELWESIHATSGAIQEAEFWLSELEKAEVVNGDHDQPNN